MKNLLENILIQPNIINEQGIAAITSLIQQSKRVDLEVFDPQRTNQTGKTEWTLDKKVRDTQHVELSPIMPQINSLLKKIVAETINPYYGFEIRDAEAPQLLCYGVGGHYHPHVDAEGIWTNPDGSKEWRKNIDRDLAVLIYLNDDYEGGNLVFPDLHISIRPKKGMMVAFPATHHYLHGVEPVTKGERFAIVTWMTVKGFPTVEDINREYEKRYAANNTTKQEDTFQL
jgi:predicted 2-oxoglutarate/Fe(II)-dependent dioxygenase YbiX